MPPSPPTATSASASSTAEPGECEGRGAPDDRESMYREMDMGFWLEKAGAEIGRWGTFMNRAGVLSRNRFAFVGLLAAPLAAEAQPAPGASALCARRRFTLVASPGTRGSFRVCATWAMWMGEPSPSTSLSADGQYERFPALAAEVCAPQAGHHRRIHHRRQSGGEAGDQYNPRSHRGRSGTLSVRELWRAWHDLEETSRGRRSWPPGLSSKRLPAAEGNGRGGLSGRWYCQHLDRPHRERSKSQEMERAASTMGLPPAEPNASVHPDDLPAAFSAAAQDGAQGLLNDDRNVLHHSPRPSDWRLATTHRLPAMYPVRDFVDSGGLMSYGANVINLYRSEPLSTWIRS